VNTTILLCDDLVILNHAEYHDDNVSNGSVFEELVEAVTKYADILRNFTFNEYRTRQENTPRLEQLLLDVEGLLNERIEEDGMVDSKLEVFMDAEKCLFATDRPELGILKDSAWTKDVLARRFK